jgi:hypothetical protein
VLGPTEHQVSAVACHPHRDVIAAGYEDGLVLLVRAKDGAEVLARGPGGSPICALAWNATGTAMALGTEEGEVGIVDLT